MVRSHSPEPQNPHSSSSAGFALQSIYMPDAHFESTQIALFKGKQIRKKLQNGEWHFVIVDVIEALTDSQNPKQYLKNMLRRDEELLKGWVQIEHPLLIDTAGGKQTMNCANTEGIFRIIQSIPSPKAEPFKRWLAKVGYERVQEIENPELATKRTRMLYKLKGCEEPRPRLFSFSPFSGILSPVLPPEFSWLTFSLFLADPIRARGLTVVDSCASTFSRNFSANTEFPSINGAQAMRALKGSSVNSPRARVNCACFQRVSWCVGCVWLDSTSWER